MKWFDSARRADIEGPSIPTDYLIRVLGQPTITVKQANQLAARQLLSVERKYWLGFYARADSDDDMRKAVEELEKLDLMEKA